MVKLKQLIHNSYQSSGLKDLDDQKLQIKQDIFALAKLDENFDEILDKMRQADEEIEDDVNHGRIDAGRQIRLMELQRRLK